ncbi:endocuticle structural glycoprotein SgAbd-1-like [Homalodisca vitripennis]|uniref:endocuticle structural glycoprotein SgAbd-1-like n=1 Tax=Homalodisca vitripennis TaxID=197043 RepID=UPI001EEB878B|nr:endocuticle structural glycoprotein SgAbd-1-like [Homalodisca vitripennis]KAG8333496.1 Insect cuticle protein [Homalodisca vitripennis]
MRVLLPLAFVCFTYSKESYFIGQNFNFKLTAERSGPPKGAQFAPIPVVNLPFSNKFSSRPLKGRPPPPPPPPPKTTRRPTQRPRPTSTTTSSPIAPPPPPVPLPVNQELPQVSEGSAVPNLPPNVTVVTPATEIRPDLETVATSPPPPPTTTPRTNDSAPALSQRSWQNEDGSYYFDFQAANSIKRAEQGFFKNDEDQINPIHVKSGMYSFTSPEGVPFRVDYVADERGYRSYIRFT